MKKIINALFIYFNQNKLDHFLGMSYEPSMQQHQQQHQSQP